MNQYTTVSRHHTSQIHTQLLFGIYLIMLVSPEDELTSNNVGLRSQKNI